MGADLIRLDSVGAFIEVGGTVRPMLANGMPDLTDMGGDVLDCSDEWLKALNVEDAQTVQWIKNDLNPTKEEN